jgi:tRNA-2-methylthio-N6-dimethylallyladenosine synthase
MTTSKQPIFTPKLYFIKTYGCQANIADSNSIAGVLEAIGYEELKVPVFTTEKEETAYILKNADLLIINTCSIRQKSEDKVYGIGKIVKQVKDEFGKKPFIVMAGCMVGSVTGDRARYAIAELQKKTSWVDAYMTPHQIYDLPSVLQKKGVLDDWIVAKYDPNNVIAKTDKPFHAFVNISYGCDNFCTFCVVPYARGPEKSRSEEEILSEIRKRVLSGVTEITLCGQNVNSWGLSMSEKFDIRVGSDQKLPFASLLRKVHEIPEIHKISFISSNPFDFTQDLIDAISLPKISNYIHIAIQSGNNEVLKRMNRRHTVEDFVALCERIVKVKPDMEIGTDIIVGFPGETEEQFMDTVDLVKKVFFSVAYIAMYSPRKGTPAQKFFKDDISLNEKKSRHALLTKVWKESKK